MLSLCVIEGEGAAAYYRQRRRLFSCGTGELPASRDMSSLPTQGGRGSEAIHPYLGFVINPRPDSEEACAYQASIATCCGVPVNTDCLFDDKPSVQPGEADRVVVGVCGGSVAFWLTVHGADTLLKELGRIARFRGKRFVLVRLALGGFEQHQQQAERRVAYRENQCYRLGVEGGDTRLSAPGHVLRQAGARFVDLTGVFAHVTESHFIDDCCHPSPHGNQPLATSIGQAIAAVPDP